MANANKKDFLADVADVLRDDLDGGKSKKIELPPKAEKRQAVPVRDMLPTEQAITSSAQVEQLQSKSKQGRTKKCIDSNIEIGTLTITPDMINSIAEKIYEINTATRTVRVHPVLDSKLCFLAKKIQYDHNLTPKSGVSKVTLVHMILESVLKDMEV